MSINQDNKFIKKHNNPIKTEKVIISEQTRINPTKSNINR